MKKLLTIFLVAYFFELTHSTTGVDISTSTTSATFTCLKNNKNSFAIVSATYTNGNIDANAIQSLQNARLAQIQTDIYITPCRGKDPINQVNSVLSAIPQKYYTTIWINIDTNQGLYCGWQNYDPINNCEYLNTMIDQIIFSYKRAGVYTSSSIWKANFGSQGCQNVAQKSALWYAYYNNVQSFADYQQFGGWASPTIKQFFGNFKLCDILINRNWQP